MSPHPRCHPQSLVIVFHVKRHFFDGESIGSAVVGIEHRLIDNKHLVGMIGSNKAFGAPAPFSFNITLHTDDLYSYFKVRVRELSMIAQLR